MLQVQALRIGGKVLKAFNSWGYEHIKHTDVYELAPSSGCCDTQTPSNYTCFCLAVEFGS